MAHNILISSGKIYTMTSGIDFHNEVFLELIEVEYVGSEWVPISGGDKITTAVVHGLKLKGDVLTITDGDEYTYQFNEVNCVKFGDTVVNSANDLYSYLQSAINDSATSGPINTVAPTTTGNDYVGQVLSGTDGTWTGTAPITYEYQWQRDGVDIPSATASTFTLTSADADEYITCTVTATNDFGSGSSVSNQVLVSINWGLGCAKNWGASTNAVWGV